LTPDSIGLHARVVLDLDGKDTQHTRLPSTSSTTIVTSYFFFALAFLPHNNPVCINQRIVFFYFRRFILGMVLWLLRTDIYFLIRGLPSQTLRVFLTFGLFLSTMNDILLVNR
jgi:hypothetical protein